MTLLTYCAAALIGAPLGYALAWVLDDAAFDAYMDRAFEGLPWEWWA